MFLSQAMMFSVYLILHVFVMLACGEEDVKVLLNGTNDGEINEPKEMLSVKPHLKEVTNWIDASVMLGQVSGVAVSPDGNLHVFHRASRKWDSGSFAVNNTYRVEKGPIREYTILTFNASNGKIVESWGENQFYMPHGLTIDSQGNMWLTDVALHQVFKFSPQRELWLTLGEAFVPAMSNDDPDHFCKPTDVVVASNGDFFVADGYCNMRIMKFSAEGELMGTIEKQYSPYSLTLFENYGWLCVAALYDTKIDCFDAGLDDPVLFGTPIWKNNMMTDLEHVHAIAYSPNENLIYGVGTDDNGFSFGFTINATMDEDQASRRDIISKWHPPEGFDSPTDLAVSPDGDSVYVGGGKKLWKFTK